MVIRMVGLCGWYTCRFGLPFDTNHGSVLAAGWAINCGEVRGIGTNEGEEETLLVVCSLSNWLQAIITTIARGNFFVTSICFLLGTVVTVFFVKRNK